MSLPAPQPPATTAAAALAAAAALEEVYGPSIWESAAHASVPPSAWEYQVRRQLNDAAYNHLQYLPYCSTMPVPARCEEPKFMWRRKERH